MREETRYYQQDMCVYCGQPITEKQRPSKVLASGEKAHLTCYLDHADEEESDLGR